MFNDEYDYRLNWMTRNSVLRYQLIITLAKFVIYQGLQSLEVLEFLFLLEKSLNFCGIPGPGIIIILHKIINKIIK